MAKRSVRRLADGSVLEESRWKAVRKRAINTYEHKCTLCGQQLDKNAPPHTRFSIEVDHIIPLHRGGQAYELDNLRLTCHPCNRAKGSKLDGEMKRQKGDYSLPISNKW